MRTISLVVCSIILIFLFASGVGSQELICDFNQNGKRIKINCLFGPSELTDSLISPLSSLPEIIEIKEVTSSVVQIDDQSFEKQIIYAELKNVGIAALTVGTASRTESFEVPVFNPLLAVEIAGVLPLGTLPDGDFVPLEQGQTYQVSIRSINLEDEPEISIQSNVKIKLDGSPRFGFEKNLGHKTQGGGLSINLKVAENSAGATTKLLFQHSDTRSPVPTKYQITLGAVDYHVTDVEQDSGIEIPPPVLKQNYPNPFNPETTIKYEISKQTRVVIKVYNVKGEFVTLLVDALKDEGSYSVRWDGKNERGKQVPAGIYFYRLQAGDFLSANRMILLK